MEEGKMSSLLAALNVDENPLVNQFMYVEEHNIADGSFIISSLMKHLIEKNQHIILILCHNYEGHFQALSRKIGYNLMWSVECGQVCVMNILDRIVNQNFYSAKRPLKDLYDDIKTQLTFWGDSKGACVIVENLSNLVFVNIEEMFAFVGYLRTVALERKNSSVICTVHDFEKCSNSELFTKSLRSFADLTVILKGLESGRASDITGHLTVIRKENKCKKTVSEYQYQLLDKSINVFAPGSLSSL